MKGVPAFYTPYIYYPISKDHRSTGFLLPSVGYTSARGYNLNAGFFWAMGRSADQTFSLRLLLEGRLRPGARAALGRPLAPRAGRCAASSST